MTNRASLMRGLFHPEDKGAYKDAERFVFFGMEVVILPAIRGIDELENGALSFRAYPSDPHDPDGHNKVHLGYFHTRAEAAEAIIAWHMAGCPSAPAHA